MSNRDDSFLYTGTTSASQKVQETKKQRKNEKSTVQSHLEPSAELITNEIRKERIAIGQEIANIIHNEMTERDIQIAVVGLKLADERLSTLQTRLLNILRTKKAPEETDE